jgi:hypothetical protein
VFQVQLDGQDPVRTSSTEHTFTGMTPGAHTVAVELVDANNTPVAGTHTEVHFMVTPANSPASPSGTALYRNSDRARLLSTALQTAAEAQQNPAQTSSTEPSTNDGLPSTGSALPLLSIIGFGVLVGGIASALKTR